MKSTSTMVYANKIKQQLKYIQTQKELKEIPAINANPLKAGTKNAELYYRQRSR